MEIRPHFNTREYTIQHRDTVEGERISEHNISPANLPDGAIDTVSSLTVHSPVKNTLLLSATSSSVIQNAAASTMTSPGLSIPLEEALRKLSAQNVEFFRTRGFFIPPLMKKTVKIDPAEMAKIMTAGSEKARSGLGAVVDSEAVVNPFSENDARDLLAFKKIDKTIHIPNPDLAAILQKAAKDNITIEGEGEIKGAFGAYRHLVSTDSGKPVRLTRNGAELALVSKDDLNDLPALETKIFKMAAVLSSLQGSAELFNLVISPIDGTTVDERAHIAQKMLSHSRENKFEDTVRNVQNDWQALKEKSKDGRDFIFLGSLYGEMLDANNDNYRRSNYREGLDLIVSRFNDHPDEAKAFNELLKRGISIPAAAKIFRTLPEPVQTGDFEQAAALFKNDSNSYFWWDPEKVEYVTSPRGNSTLQERIDIAMRLHRHCNDSNSTEKGWKNAQDEMENLTELSKGGTGFAAAGKLYADMLDANNKNYWCSDYRDGLDLIVSRFNDHPDEAKAFNELLKRGISIPAAAKIFRTLPEPVQTGDFEQAATLFKNDSNSYFWWDPEKVEYVTAPRGNSSLQERIDIAMCLHRHCKDSNSTEKGWKNAQDEMENLTELSKGGTGFAAAGKLYADMLDANNSSNWRSDYREGLDLIVSRFKDHPDEAKAFNELLKRGISIPAAAKIFRTLPEPVQTGDFEQAAALFKNDSNSYFWWSPEEVELASAPLPGTALKDRVEIVHSLHRLGRSNNSSEESCKNVRNDYTLLKEAAKSKFLHYADLYVRSLTLASRTYRDESHTGLLNLIIGDLGRDQEHWKIYEELLAHGKSLSYANEAYPAILAPVRDEALSVRKDAAKKLMGSHFAAFYEIAGRIIPPGETVLDSASLLSSIGKIRGEHSVKECEALYNRILQIKGHFTGSSVAELVKYIDFNSPEKLSGIIEDLNTLKSGNSFEERKDVFVSFFKHFFNEDKRYLDEARKNYTSLFGYLGEDDSLTAAAERFNMLFDNVKMSDDAKSRSSIKLTVECIEFIEGNIKSGNFGECTREELYADFGGLLLFCKKLDNAKSQLLHRFQSSPDSAIEHSDDAVIIGGVKLDIKNAKKSR